MGNAIGFVMTVYRKLSASSAKAINTALINRKLRLISEYEDSAQDIEGQEFDERYFGEHEENFEASSKEFFDGELEQLDELIIESEEVLKSDRKLELFLSSVIPKLLSTNSQEKILIFTEYRSAQAYLKEALESHFGNQCVELINGSMRHDERKSAIRKFESDVQFLISTEAGGEGINLQRSCHIMINYDLPWNPMRLVQRIGRLYRYGQKKRVIVLNLFSPESMDDQIIELMHERIEQVVVDLASISGEYNERLGEDILGELSDLLDIEAILEQASNEGITRTKERIEEALNKAKEAANKQRELFDYAASFNPDEIRSELNITSEHVIVFAEGMFLQEGIEVTEKTHKGNVWQIKLPDGLAQELGVKRTRYEITFDRFVATNRSHCEMMDLDNFIFKYLLGRAKSYKFGGLSAAHLRDDLTGEAVICGFLRWQSSMGVRQKQEMVSWQVDSGGCIKTNSEEFSDFLKKEPTFKSLDTNVNTNKLLFSQIERQAEEILKLKSNKLLNPEGFHPIGTAWMVDQRLEK